MEESPKTKMEKLLAKKQEIEKQIRLGRERERRENHKLDTRRKVLAGAAVLAEAEKRPEFRQELMAMLGRFLIREDERALFELPVPAEPGTKLSIVTPTMPEPLIKETDSAQSA